jgi:HPt (histidine-containing phosphotransfer) domain-containing protein
MTEDAPVRIDLPRLRQTARECGWSLAEFAEFYAPRAREELAHLEHAHAGGDGAAVVRVAHGAAGSSASVGAVSLSEGYRDVERLAGSGETASLGQPLAALGAHLERVLEALEQLTRAGA